MMVLLGENTQIDDRFEDSLRNRNPNQGDKDRSWEERDITPLLDNAMTL